MRLKLQSTKDVRFQCVYRLASGKYFVRKDGKVIGTYDSEEQAARALAQHTNVQVRDLKTRTTTQVVGKTAPSMVSGVYKCTDGKFEVRSKGQYCGRFVTEGAASKIFAKIAGVRPRASKKAAGFWAKRFRTAKKTFKTWRPADIKDLIEVRKSEPLFCLAPGPLYIIAVVGKEKAWRAAVVRLARGLPDKTKANLCALSSRIGQNPGAVAIRTAVAKDLHKLLIDACQLMTKRTSEEQEYWARHVNRNVAHHAGWLPLMQRMKILAKTTQTDKSRLVFGGTNAYKTLPFTEELVEALAKMSCMQAVLLATPPARTLDDWVAGCERFKSTAVEKRKRESYSFLWTVRSVMIAERAAAGCKKLEYSDKNTTDDISQAFPDQSRWVSYFCSDGPLRVDDFVRQLGYTDSIEYLTCDLCIFMPLAERLSTDDGEHPQVKKSRAEMDDDAHPAVVAQQAALLSIKTKSTANDDSDLQDKRATRAIKRHATV